MPLGHPASARAWIYQLSLLASFLKPSRVLKGAKQEGIGVDYGILLFGLRSEHPLLRKAQLKTLKQGPRC